MTSTIIIIGCIALLAYHLIKKGKEKANDYKAAYNMPKVNEVIEPEDPDRANYPYHYLLVLEGAGSRTSRIAVQNLLNSMDGVMAVLAPRGGRVAILSKEERPVTDFKEVFEETPFKVKKIKPWNH